MHNFACNFKNISTGSNLDSHCGRVTPSCSNLHHNVNEKFAATLRGGTGFLDIGGPILEGIPQWDLGAEPLMGVWR